MGSSHSFQLQKQEVVSASTRQKHPSTSASSSAAPSYAAHLPRMGHSLAKIPVAHPTAATIETRESGTDLPHALKRNVEDLSGLSLLMYRFTTILLSLPWHERWHTHKGARSI